ncbi:MAG TPA: hypothetical protein VJ738_14965 [Steroidobacteraceae bacterium]|nr:hypothetical protein [Steroidobacteraceae bacterium]
MAMLRSHLLLGAALIAAAGCAQQPLRADPTSSSAVSATAASASIAASNPLSASAFPPGLLVFAYEQGWRQVMAQGSHRYFCRTDAPSGSLIPQHRCVTEWQMEVERLIVQQQQQFLRQPIPYIPIRYP